MEKSSFVDEAGWDSVVTEADCTVHVDEGKRGDDGDDDG